MTNRRGARSADYTVGYGRPPKATQFKAGKTGNPRGRPKGSRTVGAILQDILRQKIAVTENGKTRRIAALEVMLRRLVNDAMRSDAKAMKLLLALVERYAETTEAKVQLGELLAEDREILAEYLLAPRGPAGKAEEPVSEPAEKAGEGGCDDADIGRSKACCATTSAPSSTRSSRPFVRARTMSGRGTLRRSLISWRVFGVARLRD
jgi:Family of unknown function (DUF5681)